MTGTSNFQLEDLLSDPPNPGGASYPSDPIPGDNREANRAYARAQAAQRGLDPEFVDRLFRIESSYNRRAVSPKGAQGIGQLMPGTAKRYGVTNPFDSRQNIDASLSYLQDLQKRFNGDTRKMAAGYFAGEDSAEKALANPKGNPKTAAYVRNVAGDVRSSGFNLENLLADAPQMPQNAPGQTATTKPFQLEDLLAAPVSVAQQPLKTPIVDTRDTMGGAAKIAGQDRPGVQMFPVPTKPENPQAQASRVIDRALGEEPAFQTWYKERAAKFGLDPNPDDPRHHYDYRAAFEAGAEPDQNGHWPSQFKAPDHPNRFVDGIDTITGERVPVGAPLEITEGRRPLETERLKATDEIPTREELNQRRLQLSIMGMKQVESPLEIPGYQEGIDALNKDIQRFNESQRGAEHPAAVGGTPLTKASRAGHAVETPMPSPTSRPAGVEINLTDYIRSGQSPTNEALGKLSYQGLGFADDEAKDFAKQFLGKSDVSPSDIAGVFYRPGSSNSSQILVNRAKQDMGGRVILPDLDTHASDSKRVWLQQYRAERGRQAAVKERSAEVERLAALPESEREDAAGKFALQQEQVGQPLTVEEQRRLGAGPIPMQGAIATDLGSIIRGAGEGFVAPTIKGVGRLFGSEKTKEFGSWIEQTTKEREALYGRRGSIGEAERTIGAIAPALATGNIGAMASLGALGSYGQGASAPRAAAEGALTYIGLKGVAKMMQYIKAPNLFRGLQALSDDELKALDEAVTTGRMKPADAAAAAETESARRISEASKFFSADKAPIGLAKRDIEFLQSQIAAGRLTEQQAAQIAQKTVAEQIRLGAAVPPLTEGEAISPVLEKLLGGAFLVAIPTMVEAAGGHPPTAESMLHNLVIAALAEGSGLLGKGKAETRTERGKIEEVSRDTLEGKPPGEGSVPGERNEPPLGTKAVWHAPEGDIPVTVTGDLGVKGGRRFVSIAESKTGIPVDELAGAPRVEGAKEPTPIPEAKPALDAQMEALTQKRGSRKAVLVTPGEQMPDVPKGMVATKTPVGTFVHDPDTIAPVDVKQRVEDSSWHSLLGIVEPKSAETTQAVVARDAAGAELQAALASPANVTAQAAELAAQHPQANIGVERPEDVIAGRLATNSQRANQTEPGQFAAKQPYEMTRSEFRHQQNEPRYNTIVAAIEARKPIAVRTQQRVTPLTKPEHIRLAKSGEIQTRERSGWVTLTDDQAAALAFKAGMKPTPLAERVYHHVAVEKAIKQGKVVSAEVLADYPELQKKAKAEAFKKMLRERKSQATAEAPPPTWATPGTSKVIDGETVWNGKFGDSKTKWAVERNGEMSSNYHETPEAAAREAKQRDKNSKSFAAWTARINAAAQKIKGGNYEDSDIKTLSGTGARATTGGMEGILRQLGLRSTDARAVIKASVEVRSTSGGANLFDIKDVIERARRKGFLPKTTVRPGEQSTAVAEVPKVGQPAAADAFTDALKSRLKEKRQSAAEQFKQKLREQKNGPEQLFQKDERAEYEDLPLSEDIKRPLLDIARSFIAEGKTDFTGLVKEFESLLGSDFEYVVDHLPAIVEHADRLHRIATAPREVTQMPAGKASDAAAAIGKASRAVTPRGIEVQTRFALFEANQPVTSHDIELRPNPHFPEGVQNRDRAKVSSEDDLIEKINRFEPEYLGQSIEAGRGAPIMGPNMAVESGNGRMIMLRRIYRDHPEQATKYKAWLKENAGKFGLTGKQVEGMTQPVLTRIRTTELSPAERIQFAEQANEETQLKLSPVEVARSDARKLNSALIAQFQPDADGNILAATNRPFIKNFLDQVVGPARGDLLTASGELSQTGVQRIRNAVFARAYADTDAGIQALEKLAEETDVNIQRVISAMVAEAPRFAALKDAIQSGARYPLDVAPDLAEAARQLSLLRDSNVSLDEFLRQGQLFGENLTSLQKKLLWVLNQNARSATKLRGILTNYLDQVEAIGDPRQQSFFSNNVPTKHELLETAVRRTNDSDATNLGSDQTQAIGGAKADNLFAERQGPQAGAGTETSRSGNEPTASAAPSLSEKPSKTSGQSTPESRTVSAPANRQSFKQALVDNFGYSEEVAHRTSEVMDALADSYVFDLKQTNPKINSAQAKEAFYRTVKIGKGISAGESLFQGVRGATEFAKTDEAIIRAGENPNESTGLHEMVHGTLPVIARLANDPNAPATLTTAIGAILEHSGFKDIPEYLRLHEGWVNGSSSKAERDSYREGSEKAARGFEGYAREGKAPTEALKAAFAKFKEWLSRIYRRLRPDMEISDRVRRGWDRLLGSEREQAAAKVKEADHWNFRRSSFASPEVESRFRMIVRDAVIEGGTAHKEVVSREAHLARVAELSPDLLPEVRRMRESQIASREIFTAAAQYAQALTKQAMDLRAQITPATLPDEAMRLQDKIAAIEHDATEIMAHTVGVRSEFGRNLALLATQKTDQLAPEKVLAFGKKLADQRGLESNSQRWKTAARKLVGLSNEIENAQAERRRITRQRKAVQDGTAKKAPKREPWQSVMLSGLRANAQEASARLQSLYGKKLYQEGDLSTDEMDRVRAKFEALKLEAKQSGQPLRVAVDDYLRQGGLFGAELNPAQQAALREMAQPQRRAALKTEQGALFETAPTLESRAEEKGQNLLFGGGSDNLLFQGSDIPTAAHDIATILAARVAEESQTKKGLPFDRILDDMRQQFPDIVGEYEDQIKATADSLLKDARRQALITAVRDPEQRVSARQELARDIANAKSVAREAERVAAQKTKQMDAAWEADSLRAQREAAAAWDKANVEFQKSQVAVVGELSKAEQQAQRVFERQQRAAVIEEARRVKEAAKFQEQERLEEIADQAREELKRAREAAMESIRSNVAPDARARRKAEREAPQKARRWEAPIVQAAAEARARIAQPDYTPTVEDLAAIGAEKSIQPDMTASRWHREMNQYGEAYTKNARKIRDGAAEMKVNARRSAITRRVEEIAAGKAEGVTKPAEQAQAREDYQKWQADELARLAAEEEWQNKRIRTAKRDLAREFAKLQKPAMLDTVLDVLGLPMSLVSSIDLPGLRQGIIPLMNHPKIWIQGLRQAASTWTGAQEMRKVDALENHPLAELMRLSGLKQSSLEQRRAPLSRLAREEQFQNRFARLFPHVRVSERQFTIMMDEMRARLFTDLATPMLSNYPPALHPEHYSELSRLINIMTGIGEIGGITKYAPAINRLLFSTRLMVSRFQFLAMPVSPHFWRDMPPPVRKIATREWVGFWGKAAALFGTLAALGLTSLDPDDDDFLKLSIPGTQQKWELLGNYSSYLKFVAKMVRSAYRIATGQKEFKGDRAQDTIEQFGRSKLAPAPGIAYSWMKGRTFLGEPFQAKQAAIDSVTPMFLKDVYDAVKLDGTRGLVMAPFGILGGGVSSYRSRKMPDRTQSQAERYATGFLRDKMASAPETSEEYKRRNLITEMLSAKKASKPTDRIERDLQQAGGPLSRKEQESFDRRMAETPLQHAYPYLSEQQKQEVLEVATPEERAQVEPHAEKMSERLKRLMDSDEYKRMPAAEKAEAIKRIAQVARKGKQGPEMELDIARDTEHDRLTEVIKSRPEFKALGKDLREATLEQFGQEFAKKFAVPKETPEKTRLPVARLKTKMLEFSSKPGSDGKSLLERDIDTMLRRAAFKQRVQDYRAQKKPAA